jgi:ATP-dependent DNA helicase RecQ
VGPRFPPGIPPLRELRDALPGVPAIALTATATPRVREDILTQLGLRDAAVFLASFNRPNLNYLVEPKQNAAARIVEFIRGRGQESGIVYCQSRKRSEELAATLRNSGIPAVCYHAGLEAARTRPQPGSLPARRSPRRLRHRRLRHGHQQTRRPLRHPRRPAEKLEGYYQETGRAGRDGLPADCLLLYSRGDVAKLLRFTDEIPDEEARDHARLQLDQMADFAECDGCRRTGLLGYFGETWPQENCGGCDNCLSPRETWDATTEAQKFLSCILRVKQSGHPPVGIRHLSDILAGSRSEKVLAKRHDQLSTYGIGREHSATKWAELARQLARKGWIAIDGGTFPTVTITADGAALLRERRPVSLTRLMATDKPAVRQRAGDIECDTELFEILRAHRKQTADAAGVPPYVVFSDVALRHMARAYPTTDASFLQIPGVGERKLADYGPGFIGLIAGFLETHDRRHLRASRTLRPASPGSPKPVVNSTAQVTLELWRSGKSVDEIADERDLSTSTIENHLAQAIANGEPIDPRRFYTAAEEAEIRAALDGYTEEALKPVFEHLEARVSYGKLRIFRAFEEHSGVSHPS